MNVDDYIEDSLTLWNNNSDKRTIVNSSENGVISVGNGVPIIIPFFPLGLGIIIITLLGIIGNILSALVLSRRRLQSSYSVLTLGLTFVDSVYLLTKFLRYGIASFFSYYSVATHYTDIFLPIVGPFLRPITFTAHTASTYFTITIALDRYIAVCWPLQARFFCTRRRAHYYAAVVFLFSILYNIPRWYEFHTEKFNVVNENNQTSNIRYSMEISDLRQHPNYKLFYIFWSYFVVMFVIPFVCLSYFNFCIWNGIRNSAKKGVTLTSVQSRDNSFAAMLVGVVIVFLLCNVDYLILDLMEFFGMSYSESWNHIGNFLLTLNSSVNFLIYCVCGWKFREELTKMLPKLLGCRCRRGVMGSHDINSSGYYEKDSYYTQHYNMETPTTVKSAP